MTLTQDTASLARWHYRATRRLVQVDQRAALRLIISMSLNQIITVLVFFLPLKIVLLVAADGVPQYFNFLVSKNTKMPWLAGLSATIFILYFVSLRLDNVAARSASRGATSLVNACTQVPVTSDPTEFARTTFYRLGESVGCLSFSLLALAGGIAIFPSFFTAMPLLFALQFGLVHVALQRQNPGRLQRWGRYIQEQPQNLLNYLQDVSFLIIFALLILYFLILTDLNPLLGIAAIMLSRRILGSVKRIFQNGIRFSKNRQIVDTLLFVDVQVTADENADQDNILQHSAPDSRPVRIRALMEPGSSSASVESYVENSDSFELIQSVEKSVWVDSGRKGKAIFDFHGYDFDGEYKRLLRDYLYTRKASRGLEQHDYLLKFLDAEALRCPRRILEYQYDNLVGRMVDFRGIEELGAEAWQKRREELLKHLWSLELPVHLVQAYDSAHPRFQDRLDSSLISSLSTASDEPWSQSTYRLIASRISEMRERLAELPLTLLNERLGRLNILVGPAGESYFADWTWWTIQPIGAGFLPERDAWDLLEVAAWNANGQSEQQSPVSANDVLLSSLLHRIDWLTRKGYPKAALKIAWGMSPLIDQPDTVALENLTLGAEEVDDEETEVV